MSWSALTSMEDVQKFIDEVGYPVLEAHLFHQLFGRFDGFVAGGHGQCETQLRFAVVHCVAVGLYLFQVEGLVEIPAFG